MRENQEPKHDVLVTNPPYSGDHKKRCLEYCRASGKPWFLLVPNYVATKDYYRLAVLGPAAGPGGEPFYVVGVGRSEAHPVLIYSVLCILLRLHDSTLNGDRITDFDDFREDVIRKMLVALQDRGASCLGGHVPACGEGSRGRALSFLRSVGAMLDLSIVATPREEAVSGSLVHVPFRARGCTPTACPPRVVSSLFQVPESKYSFDHPEGTGHANSPFSGVWYVHCGSHTEAVFQGATGEKRGGVSVLRSLDELSQTGAVTTVRRLNPRQRKALKKKRNAAAAAATGL